MDYAKKYMNKDASLKEVIDLVIKDINEFGLDILINKASAHLAWFRPFELAFTLNRLRGFEVKQRSDAKHLVN